MGLKFQPVTHCIFDMDGLLIDSEIYYTKMFNEIVNPYGKVFTWEHKAKTMGFSSRETAKKLVELMVLPITPEEFHKKWMERAKTIFADCSLMPGVERLLRHLHANNILFSLATSSPQHSFEQKTKKIRPIFDLFHHKILGGSDPDVKMGKPSPDIFLVAASRFPDKPDPSNCLVFEDSPNGVLAALSAGMQVVMIPDPNLPAEMISKDVTLKLNSLEEFNPKLFGLPKF